MSELCSFEVIHKSFIKSFSKGSFLWRKLFPALSHEVTRSSSTGCDEINYFNLMQVQINGKNRVVLWTAAVLLAVKKKEEKIVSVITVSLCVSGIVYFIKKSRTVVSQCVTVVIVVIPRCSSGRHADRHRTNEGDAQCMGRASPAVIDAIAFSINFLTSGWKWKYVLNRIYRSDYDHSVGRVDEPRSKRNQCLCGVGESSLTTAQCVWVIDKKGMRLRRICTL